MNALVDLLVDVLIEVTGKRPRRWLPKDLSWNRDGITEQLEQVCELSLAKMPILIKETAIESDFILKLGYINCFLRELLVVFWTAIIPV